MTGENYFPTRALSYPRSFLGLLVAAFLLVALPLMGTLLYSAWHIERLTEQSRSAVSGAAAAARASRSMVNRKKKDPRGSFFISCGEDFTALPVYSPSE